MDYAHYDHKELIEMSYEKIIWKYLEGNIFHSDSWETGSEMPE